MSLLFRELRENRRVLPSNLKYEICRQIEEFWSRKITDKKVKSDSIKYVVAMFPYPSGTLHMGHARVYYNAAIHADYLKLIGHKVIFPIGWDSFGLPAENAARIHKISPSEWTKKNIFDMKRQFKTMKLNFDFSREISTCNPKYYKWTQWLFLKLFEYKMAYKSFSPVIWDPLDQTFLANQEVNPFDSTSIRSGAKVQIKFSNQWFISTTKFNRILYDNLQLLPQKECDQIIRIQKNLLGVCQGYTTNLHVYLNDGTKVDINVYFEDICNLILGSSKLIVTDLCQIYSIDEIKIRLLDGQLFAQDKLNGKFHEMTFMKSSMVKHFYPNCATYHDAKIPFFEPSQSNFIDYYMFESNIELKRAIECKTIRNNQSVKSRDWMVSRQRKWGTPIPIYYCPKCGLLPYPYDVLPVSWNDPIDMTCFKCGSMSKRETDTLDTFFDSSWYYYRFLDKSNDNEIFSKSKVRPVDIYIGGEDHARLHLFYARFMTTFMNHIGVLDFFEPFKRIVTVGSLKCPTYHDDILNTYLSSSEVQFLPQSKQYISKSNKNPIRFSLEKMSKSKSNGISPESLIKRTSCDLTRIYTAFSTNPKSFSEYREDTFRDSNVLLNNYFLIIKNLTIKPNQRNKNSNINNLVCILNEKCQKEDSIIVEIKRRRHYFLRNVHVFLDQTISPNSLFLQMHSNAKFTHKITLNHTKDPINDVLMEFFHNQLSVLSIFTPHIAQEFLMFLRQALPDCHIFKNDFQIPVVSEDNLNKNLL